MILLIAFLNVFILLIFDYKCPWKKLFHIDCAGCGGTRMFIAVLKLDFYQAFRYNPLLFVLLVGTVIYFCYVIIFKLLGRDYFKFNINYLWGLLFLTIGFMILRNISIFDFLKPTVVS